MNKLLFFTCLLLAGTSMMSSAQVSTVNNSAINMELRWGIGPVYTYEYSLGRKFTVLGGAGINYSLIEYINNVFDLDSKNASCLAIQLNLQPRFYYNLDRRERLERKTLKNSADFFTLDIGYRFEPFYISVDIDGKDILWVVPKWGMHRALGEHWLFDLTAGIGYIKIGDKTGANISVSTGFGYSF